MSTDLGEIRNAHFPAVQVTQFCGPATLAPFPRACLGLSGPKGHVALDMPGIVELAAQLVEWLAADEIGAGRLERRINAGPRDREGLARLSELESDLEVAQSHERSVREGLRKLLPHPGDADRLMEAEGSGLEGLAKLLRQLRENWSPRGEDEAP